MTTKIYCDICNKEIIPSTMTWRQLKSYGYDQWHQKLCLSIKYDLCDRCYLDIKDEIERKIKFYRDKHEMGNGCKITQ